MSLVAAEKYEQIIARYYGRYDEEIHAPVVQMLQTNPKVRKAISDFLNGMLQHFGQEATRRSVVAKSMVVTYKINLVKQAQNFWGKLPKGAQNQLKAEMILLSFELLLEEAGYIVENHTMSYDLPILDEPEGDELEEEDEESEEIEIGQIEAAAPGGMSLSEQPAAPVAAPTKKAPSVQPDNDGDDDHGMNMNPFVLTQETIQVGAVYGNGKGIHRRVDSFEDGRVGYTVTKGKGSVKEGASSETSYKSLVGWAAEVISDPA